MLYSDLTNEAIMFTDLVVFIPLGYYLFTKLTGGIVRAVAGEADNDFLENMVCLLIGLVAIYGVMVLGSFNVARSLPRILLKDMPESSAGFSFFAFEERRRGNGRIPFRDERVGLRAADERGGQHDFRIGIPAGVKVPVPRVHEAEFFSALISVCEAVERGERKRGFPEREAQPFDGGDPDADPREGTGSRHAGEKIAVRRRETRRTERPVDLVHEEHGVLHGAVAAAEHPLAGAVKDGGIQLFPARIDG